MSAAVTSTTGTPTRRLRWWDLEEVLAVEGPAFGADAWSREAFLSELAGPGRHYLLAGDGTVDGYLGVAVNGPDAELQTIAVAPRRRGRGLGRLLLQRAVEVAAQAGARRLHLEVREDNAAAVALYTSAGFSRQGRRPGYYAAASPGGPRTAALLLQADLRGQGS